MQKKIISLRSYGGTVEDVSYLVLSCRDTEETLFEEVIFALTPTVMRWDHDLWIFDLRECSQYWFHKAERSESKSRGDIYGFLVQLLQTKGLGKGCGVFCENPWQGVLLCRQIVLRGIFDFVDRKSAFGEKLYQGIHWSTWFAEVEFFLQHRKALDLKKTSVDEQQLKKMKKVVSLLPVQNIEDLKDLCKSSIHRRFGKTLASLWGMTYAKNNHTKMVTNFFPWILWQKQETTEITRNLDDPLWEWDHIEEYLLQDVERLRKKLEHNMHRGVCALEWQLTMQNLERLTVPILFKHPHDLAREINTQQTVLTQTRLSYERQIAALYADKERHVLIHDYGLICWSLKVKKTAMLPRLKPKMLLLGGTKRLSLLEQKRQKVRYLENKLAIPLRHYKVAANYSLERSYSEEVGGNNEDNKNNEKRGCFSMTSWQRSAFYRPLFVFKERHALKQETQIEKCTFLERVYRQWWQIKKNDSFYFCDYYMFFDEKQKKYLWLFREADRQWFYGGQFH